MLSEWSECSEYSSEGLACLVRPSTTVVVLEFSRGSTGVEMRSLAAPMGMSMRRRSFPRSASMSGNTWQRPVASMPQPSTGAPMAFTEMGVPSWLQG